MLCEASAIFEVLRKAFLGRGARHAEGGRNPIGRFERTLADCSDRARTLFWSGNFERVFGGV